MHRRPRFEQRSRAMVRFSSCQRAANGDTDGLRVNSWQSFSHLTACNSRDCFLLQPPPVVTRPIPALSRQFQLLRRSLRRSPSHRCHLTLVPSLWNLQGPVETARLPRPGAQSDESGCENASSILTEARRGFHRGGCKARDRRPPRRAPGVCVHAGGSARREDQQLGIEGAAL
jgi:hypothetical protein